MPSIDDIAQAIYGYVVVIGPRCCKRADFGKGSLEGGYYCRNCGAVTTLEKAVRLKVKKAKRGDR